MLLSFLTRLKYINIYINILLNFICFYSYILRLRHLCGFQGYCVGFSLWLLLLLFHTAHFNCIYYTFIRPFGLQMALWCISYELTEVSYLYHFVFFFNSLQLFKLEWNKLNERKNNNNWIENEKNPFLHKSFVCCLKLHHNLNKKICPSTFVSYTLWLLQLCMYMICSCSKWYFFHFVSICFGYVV